ncbi:MAG: hypothetical protein HY059_10060 [Proteobacteria bacterium]|nr:hypothetical protein [Pseudomonadota bacterium]
MTIEWKGWLDLALWLAGVGNFCTMGAGLQVPYRLGWKEDLAKLTPFNRKLMWTHGGFAILTIGSFGLLTLGLHREMMRGDRAALALAALIGVYWTMRIIVDFVYYDHADWPEGRAFVWGHALLTALFVAMAVAYGWLLAHHLSGGRV